MTQETADYFAELKRVSDLYRNFDHDLYAPFALSNGDYRTYMLDVAYPDRDEAVGPFTWDEVRQVFAERVAREAGAGAGGAVLVRILEVEFTEDAVVHTREGVFDFSCNPAVASCLNFNGGTMSAGCGNRLSDSYDTRWENPRFRLSTRRGEACRRREDRHTLFASLGTTNEKSLVAKRTWED